MIVSKSPKAGTIRIEADEAEISRGPQPKDREADEVSADETWLDDNELPMHVRFKGNVVVREDQGKITGQRDQRTIRAPVVEFDYAADHLLATDAQLEIIAPGLLAPIKITSPRIEVFHPVARRPDGSLAPSENREIRAGDAVQPKPMGAPSSSATAGGPKALALQAITPRADKFPAGKIAKIEFDGNATITPDKIKPKHLSRVGQQLDHDKVEADLKTLMGTKWFSNVTYYLDESPPRSASTF